MGYTILDEVSTILEFDKGKHYQTVLEIFRDEVYEKVQKVTSGMVVVDAGAGIGEFTVKACMQVGEGGFVYAFEPEPENFSLLKKNTSKLSNVKVYSRALWSRSEIHPLHIRSDHWAGHSMYPYGLVKEIIDVKAVMLDESVICKVDFLKVDVESAELEVFKGAKRILSEYKPFIAVEIHDSKLFFEIVEFLKYLGYSTVGEINPYHVGVHCFAYSPR